MAFDEDEYDGELEQIYEDRDELVQETSTANTTLSRAEGCAGGRRPLSSPQKRRAVGEPGARRRPKTASATATNTGLSNPSVGTLRNIRNIRNRTTLSARPARGPTVTTRETVRERRQLKSASSGGSMTQRIYPPVAIQAKVDAEHSTSNDLIRFQRPKPLKYRAVGKELDYIRKVKADKREARRLKKVYEQREAGFRNVRDGEKPLAVDDVPIKSSGANSLQPISCLLKGSWDRPGINRDRKYRYDGPLLAPTK